MSILFILAALAINWDKTTKLPAPFFDEIAYACSEVGEDIPLILAVIYAESRFQEDALSPKGAVGLMQVMPETAKWMADRIGLEGYSEEKLAEREWNLTIGISYMHYLKQQFPGSLTQAVAAYNAGPNRVRSWMRDGQWDGSYEFVADIPFNETRNYVIKVMKAYQNYLAYYSQGI
jgi:soluble lytic murein transglycosylase